MQARALTGASEHRLQQRHQPRRRQSGFGRILRHSSLLQCHCSAKAPLDNAFAGLSSSTGSIGASISESDEEEVEIRLVEEHESLGPVIALATDWAALQMALISRGTAENLTVEDVVGVLKRAAQLSNRSEGLMVGPAGSNSRLLARTVVALCCLILLREIESLDTVTVSGALTALGVLAAHGALPPVNGRDAPKELLVAAFHLTRRARIASSRGLLGPNQLAGVLRGGALLAPQFVTHEWLEEVERQLKPEVMPDLAPASVAALLSAITKARAGRCRRWRPAPAWVAALQEDVSPRLKHFSGFELAATAYGLVELTTPSNPSPPAMDPAQVPQRKLPSANTTAMSLGLGPFRILGARQRTAADWFRLLEEQRRIEQEQAKHLSSTEMAAVDPSFVEQLNLWEQQWRDRKLSSASAAASASGAPNSGYRLQPQPPAAATTAIDTATDSATSAQTAADTPATQDTASQQPSVASEQPVTSGQSESSPPSTTTAAALSQPTAQDSVDYLVDTTGSDGSAVDSMDIVTQPALASTDSGADSDSSSGGGDSGGSGKRSTKRVVTYHLSASDLALLLVAKTRLAQPGFVPARPRWFGMLPLEVSYWEQELGLVSREGLHDEYEEEDL